MSCGPLGGRRLHGVVVIIPAPELGDPGSIPGGGILLHVPIHRSGSVDRPIYGGSGIGLFQLPFAVHSPDTW